LKEEQVQAKINAINCYQSQNFRKYHSPNFLRSLATTRGIQISSDYAEAFELIRWIE
jgi:LmbE family N-acetylglucosaminyl deacetylase